MISPILYAAHTDIELVRELLAGRAEILHSSGSVGAVGGQAFPNRFRLWGANSTHIPHVRAALRLVVSISRETP
jgi:hypothetical protein